MGARNIKQFSYDELLELGEEFQDFLMVELAKRNIIIQCYSSKKYQYKNGESLSGHEIKFDRKMSETDNLYIEVKEKDKNGKMGLGGIYNPFSKSKELLIGDFSRCFKLSIMQLRAHVERLAECEEESLLKAKIKYIKGETSEGWVLPIAYLRRKNLLLDEFEF